MFQYRIAFYPLKSIRTEWQLLCICHDTDSRKGKEVDIHKIRNDSAGAPDI